MEKTRKAEDPLDLFLDKQRATSSEDKLTKPHEMEGKGAHKCKEDKYEHTQVGRRPDKRHY